MATAKPKVHAIKPLKRSDLVAQEIKRLITEKDLSPGDRLPRESELQAQFQVSKGTIREALKALEVQGLVTMSTGPSGGGTIAEVPLDRTLQFPFHPHVTVAHDVEEGWLDEAFDAMDSYRAAFDVDHLGLFVQGGDGIWRQRAEFGFGG